MSTPKPFIGTFIAKGEGGSNYSDPLDQRRTLGLKMEIDGVQYGVVLGTKTLEEMGIRLTFPSTTRNVTIRPLVEGVPPVEE